ncbi:ABC transporter ATP-binding protein [Pseudohoeflea coraliihabitans]|uniref:ABC transporter ATP-binding protein n=1 Tax=Pseudohoeflea coraliihabitans TaxID=2860393 RepID=A0ABS6WQ39_9HYPH|nr:ABC transporter ATP-binding protein [Pseudohoeflea sp. DP4N28-3]MBW3098035.1 ABC transporter ATP-binding protein [Pseudohoeflea sp. DP4N28-3]
MDETVEQPILEVVDVLHKYGSVTALDHVSLQAKRGEFLTILGSSGSGKTTMLRVISGLEQPTQVGKLAIGGVDVRGKPPSKRNCTTVFQNYALFPHMSVAENVAYGLKVRNVPREDARKQAMQALAMVQLESKSERRIAQLSGGERQRVALARAAVTRPAILLLDEPLGALDERLRIDMQSELVEIQRALGMTFVYITHSQEEALTMSDRVVLMSHGRIEQSGRPVDLFDRPATLFAAGFMGYENILPGRLTGRQGDQATVELAGGITVRGVASEALGAVGTQAALAVRAERMALLATADGDAGRDGANVLAGTLRKQIYHGKYTDQTVDTAAGTIRLRRWDRVPSAEQVGAVAWQPEDCIVLPA